MAIVVNLLDYSGSTGASPATLVSAFSQAFADLKANGGGELIINAGTYNFGPSSGGTFVSISGLESTRISASGALFQMTTSIVTTPVFFRFQNCNDITVHGMRLNDTGSDIGVEWRGAVCFLVLSTVNCSGFNTESVSVSNCVTFMQSQPDSADYFKITHFNLQATLTNCYYGVNANQSGRSSTCDLVCNNVRRGFIAHSPQNWDIHIDMRSTAGGLGSNGFCYLVPINASFPPRDNNINISVAGSTNPYNTIVNFGHQGNSNTVISCGTCSATLAFSASGSAAAYRFLVETQSGTQTGILTTSNTRTWNNLKLDMLVVGTYTGTAVLNTTVSSIAGNDVGLYPGASGRVNFGSLPSYFSAIDYPEEPPPDEGSPGSATAAPKDQVFMIFACSSPGG